MPLDVAFISDEDQSKIDIAVMQSLSRKGEVKDLVETYGHIVAD